MAEQGVSPDIVGTIAEKWREKKGSLIMVLHEIQSHYGYIPRPVAMNLARVIDVPLARIYEVISRPESSTSRSAWALPAT